VSGGSRRTAIIVLAVALVVSLCLNLFVAGAWFAGRVLGGPVASAIAAVMQSYPLSLRQEIRRQVFEQRDAILTAVADLRDARARMFALMRGDPLDTEALQRAMAEVRDKTTTVQALLQSALAASLAETPAAEREKIVSPSFGFSLFEHPNP
jgi:uncharacterized membrane protein